jgi:integrase
MKEFSNSTGINYSFDDITLEWRVLFIKFLQSKGNARNTEGKHIKIVKLIMAEATERGLNSNLIFRSKGFQKPTEDINKIFLTLDEITKLANLDLSQDNLKETIRDYFVISCCIALRYSDVIRIRKEYIKDGFIEMNTIKTGTPVIIPISTLVQNILDKYNYNLPKAPCNQIFNRYFVNTSKTDPLAPAQCDPLKILFQNGVN